MNRRIVGAVLTFFVAVAAFSEEEEGRLWQFLPTPVLFYTPETGLGGGAAVTALHSPPGSATVDTLGGIGVYTQKNQISLGVSGDWYLADGRRRLFFSASAMRFPSVFFGIGPETVAAAEESYKTTTGELVLAYRWLVGSHLSVGPRYRLLLTDTDDLAAGGILEKGTIAGSDGATVSGSGAEIVWDDRDDTFWPTHGAYLIGRVTGYPSWLGNTEAFLEGSADGRVYWEMAPRVVLALQGVIELSGGEVPFQAMPALGGSGILRGYLQPRYIDGNRLAVQAEVRYPLFWRFGGVVFGGFGKVAPEVLELVSANNVRAAGGAGLRMQLSQQVPLNLRFDLAYSPEGSQFYVSIMEAF